LSKTYNLLLHYKNRLVLFRNNNDFICYDKNNLYNNKNNILLKKKNNYYIYIKLNFKKIFFFYIHYLKENILIHKKKFLFKLINNYNKESCFFSNNMLIILRTNVNISININTNLNFNIYNSNSFLSNIDFLTNLIKFLFFFVFKYLKTKKNKINFYYNKIIRLRNYLFLCYNLNISNNFLNIVKCYLLDNDINYLKLMKSKIKSFYYNANKIDNILKPSKFFNRKYNIN